MRIWLRVEIARRVARALQRKVDIYSLWSLRLDW